MYLLDTCAISELWKPVPNVGLANFIEGLLDEELFLSVITLGEIKKGVDRLPAGKRKTGLYQAYTAMRLRYSLRVLSVTVEVAERWAELDVEAEPRDRDWDWLGNEVAERWAELDVEAGRRGRHLKALDGLIAATANLSGLTVVTRNVSDFDMIPVPWVNPWT